MQKIASPRSQWRTIEIAQVILTPMDFFERQEKARRQTTFLIAMFVLAVIGIVFAVDIVIGTVAANVGGYAGQFVVPGLDWVSQNLGLLTATSAGTVGFVGMASMFRVARLRSGGGSVARSLGAALVPSDTQDPLRRRLHNVVEEMAIASGVPVPEVYVMEHESGLNAFAAGFTTGDAAITVTRGLLESLSRNELQGVIAHEFSHVLNGDMRMNMRLIGILFGILAVHLVGRTILRSTRHTRVRSRNSRDGGGAGAIIAVGVSLAVIGYIGLFFGRLIKAAVSRQREYLADASAVQFTRQTEGISGALKKIGFGAQHSYIEEADGEEVSHMLFANGFSRIAALYATHPPIVERIQALQPNFNPERYEQELDQKSKQASVHSDEPLEKDAEEKNTEAQDRLQRMLQTLLVLAPEAVTQTVGNPNAAHVHHASELHRMIPGGVRTAAHSSDGAHLLVLSLLMDKDAAVRTQQLALLERELTAQQLDTVCSLRDMIAASDSAFRLPVMEMAFPALKSRPVPELQKILSLIEALVNADGRVDTFEYLLSRLLYTHLQDAENPHRRTTRSGVRLSNSIDALYHLFSVVASIGHPGDSVQSQKAYQKGLQSLLPVSVSWPDYHEPKQWTAQTDAALERLDWLPVMVKGELVKALVTTISHDGKVSLSEAEILRATCGVLHCPLPPFL